MLIRQKPVIRSFQITPEHNYLNRRDFIGSTALAGTSLLFAPGCAGADDKTPAANPEVNSFEDITRFAAPHEGGIGKGEVFLCMPPTSRHEPVVQAYYRC